MRKSPDLRFDPKYAADNISTTCRSLSGIYNVLAPDLKKNMLKAFENQSKLGLESRTFNLKQKKFIEVINLSLG